MSGVLSIQYSSIESANIEAKRSPTSDSYRARALQERKIEDIAVATICFLGALVAVSVAIAISATGIGLGVLVGVAILHLLVALPFAYRSHKTNQVMIALQRNLD